MSIIDEAKSKLDLRSMISLTGQRDCGDYSVAPCPFHDDKHPSFLIYKNGWRCLSSNCTRKRGSALDWIAHERGIDNPTGNDIIGIAIDVVANPVFHYSADERVINPSVRKRKVLRKKIKAPLDQNLAQQYYNLHTPKSRGYLINRGFSYRDIRFYKFGFGGDAITIPVWEGVPGKSKLLSLRFRNLHDEPRYYGLRGYNEAMLFNRFIIDVLRDMKQKSRVKMSEPLYVFFGEFDAALALAKCSIPAVSPTNGCNVLEPDWFDGLDKVYIVPDYGEEEQAIKACAKIGVRAEVITLPYSEACGKDFTEQWLSLPYYNNPIVTSKRAWLKHNPSPVFICSMFELWRQN